MGVTASLIVDHPGVEPRGEGAGSAEVAAPDAGRQPERAGVGGGDGRVVVLDAPDDHDRAEDACEDALGFVVAGEEDGRRVEPARAVDRLGPREHLRAGGDRRRGSSRGTRSRAASEIIGPRSTSPLDGSPTRSSRARRASVGPAVGVADDVDPLDRHAGLARADERGPGQGAGRRVERGVGQDDRRGRTRRARPPPGCPGPRARPRRPAVVDAAGEEPLVESLTTQRPADLGAAEDGRDEPRRAGRSDSSAREGRPPRGSPARRASRRRRCPPRAPARSPGRSGRRVIPGADHPDDADGPSAAVAAFISANRCQPGPIRESARAERPFLTVQRMASSAAMTSIGLGARLADLVADRQAQRSASRARIAHQRRTTSSRSRMGRFAQALEASRARSTSAATSPGGVAGTRPSSAPVAGLRAIRASASAMAICRFPYRGSRTAPGSARLGPYAVPRQVTRPVRHIRIDRAQTQTITRLASGNHAAYRAEPGDESLYMR